MLTTLKMIFSLFTPAERRSLFWLAPAVALMALLEVAGIASITPFLALIADPNQVREIGALYWLYTQFGFADMQAFLIFLGLSALAMLALSNAVSAGTMWLLFRFSHARNHSISARLLSHYLSRPYPFFVTRNTSELAQTILSEVHQVVNGVVIAVLMIVARVVAVTFIAALLVAASPSLALGATALIGGSYAAVYALTRRRLAYTGKARVRANAERFRAVHEAFGAVKALKLGGREGRFLGRFSAPSERFAHYMAVNQTLAHLPRYALETVAFGGILLVVIYFLAAGRDLAQALPLIGLYAFAGYRLLPSVQLIFSSAANIRFHHAALTLLYGELETAFGEEGDATAPTLTHDDLAPLPFRERLEVHGLAYHHPGRERATLAEIALSIRPGESVAFVGTTGSGKTTLVDVLIGLLPPSKGTLTLDGQPLIGDTLKRWQRAIGYVPQHIYLSDDTVAANIAFGIPPEQIDKNALVRSAKLAQLHDFIVGELEGGYDTHVGERGVRLSGGQRQRIGVARALYHQPSVLVLDEATSALDPRTEAAILEHLGSMEGTRTTITVTHRLSSVGHCDQIFLLESGRIIARGTYAEITAERAFRELAHTQEPVGAP